MIEQAQKAQNEIDVKSELNKRLIDLANKHAQEVTYAQQLEKEIQQQQFIIQAIEAQYREVERTMHLLKIPVPQKPRAKTVRQIVQDKIAKAKTPELPKSKQEPPSEG